MTPVVSLIIPCHNRVELLFELVESIPRDERIEVIIVDDHSDDELSTVPLDEFFCHQLVQMPDGVRYAGNARNAGIANSAGEYVFFADSDDLVAPEGFIRCLDILIDKRPDILFTQSTSFDHFTGNIGDRHVRNNWLVGRVLSGAPPEILVRFGGPVAKFVRREYISENKLKFEAQKFSNDIYFAASLMCFDPQVAACEEVAYCIREGNTSLTTETTVESLEMRLEALIRYNLLLRSNGLGYLAAPAAPFLLRLIRLAPMVFVRWALKVRFMGTPLALTWWHVANIFLRFRSSQNLF